MKSLFKKKACLAAGACIVVLLPSAREAFGQSFYVGEDTGNIEYATSSGTTTYATAAANDVIGGMSFDAFGNLYVTDMTAGNVYKYSASGAQSTFATGLMSPGDIAVDSAGNVYVANTTVGTIIKYPSTGGAGTTYASGLLMPQAITFGPTGIMYVAEEGSGTANSGQISTIPAGGGMATALVTGLAAPIALTLNPDASALYVGMYDSASVSGFATSNGAAVNTYAGVTLSGPASDLTMDTAGNLYVAQYGSGTASVITEITPDGTTSTFATLNGDATGFVLNAVPEPGAVCGVALGIAGLLAARRRRFAAKRGITTG